MSTDPCQMGTRIRDVASRTPDKTAFVFYRRHDDKGEVLTWGDLWDQAARVSNALPNPTNPSNTGVLVFCDDEKNFVIALLATWMIGAVAIPATGGLNANLHGRNQHILTAGKPDIVLHDLPTDKAQALQGDAPHAVFVSLPGIAPDDAPSDPVHTPVARVLQFTSGSTANPKPVLLDALTIAAGCRTIETTYGLSADSVGVSWLPLYHDMGLVGHVLETFWAGGTSVLLRPSVFIQRPLKWLATLSEWRATITSGPNFAYDRLCNAVRDGDLAGLDLSPLKTVVIGGEPVAQSTVLGLIDTLAPCGLSPDAIAPSYGMAEVTLLASSGQRPGGPEFDTRHSTMPLANLGPVVPGLTVSIRNDNAPCPDGTIGEIWLDGTATGRVIPPGQDWRRPPPKTPIQTGDYGYLEDGNIHITGRASNKIIIRGQNVFAEDIEAMTLDSQPDGFSSGIAAFGITKQGTESLCILIEQARRNDPLDHGALNQRLVSTLGVKPDTVVLLRRFALPRTSSGKIRRALARDEYLNGAYDKKTVAHA